jgi:hypothetical protein
MHRLMTMAVGVAALCGMTAFAQPVGTNQPTPRMPRGTLPPPPEPLTSDEHILFAHSEAEVLHRALMEGAHDPAMLKLADKALADRATLLQSELDRVTKLRALVTAIQSGDKAALGMAREDVKTSMEAMVANAKIFLQDVNAIREHLRPPRRQRQIPGQMLEGTLPTPGATVNP